MNPPEPSHWGPVRILLWWSASVVLIMLLGPRLVGHMRPQVQSGEVAWMDFSQEWLSARNYLTGTPVYSNQTESLLRHTGHVPTHPEDLLPWNAHPPAAILLTLPFGYLDYRTAHLVWNLLTLPLFLVAVWMIIRELQERFVFWLLLPALVVLLLFAPLYSQLAQGQLSNLILFLLTAAWAADRRDRQGWAGVAVGLAAALKLFPAFVFVYFLFAGRRKAILTGAAAFLAVNSAALAVLGLVEFRTYIYEVIPSLSSYRSTWNNSSLSGFWLRLFDPNPTHKIIPLVVNPILAKVLVASSILLATATVAFASWKALSVSARDRAFALSLVGMVLVSPVAWEHYIVLLMLPIWLVWMRTPAGPWRIVMWATLIDLWLPHRIVVNLLIGPDQADAILHDRHNPISPVVNLAMCSLYTYGLLGLFLLLLVSPAGEVGAARDSLEDQQRPAVDLQRRLFGAPVREQAPALVNGTVLDDNRSSNKTTAR